MGLDRSTSDRLIQEFLDMSSKERHELYRRAGVFNDTTLFPSETEALPPGATYQETWDPEYWPEGIAVLLERNGVQEHALINGVEDGFLVVDAKTDMYEIPYEEYRNGDVKITKLVVSPYTSYAAVAVDSGELRSELLEDEFLSMDDSHVHLHREDFCFFFLASEFGNQNKLFPTERALVYAFAKWLEQLLGVCDGSKCRQDK